EVEGAQCPYCGQSTVEGTLQQEQAYRRLAVRYTLVSLGAVLISNLLRVAVGLYLSHLPRDARGGIGFAFSFMFRPLVLGLGGLGAFYGVIGLINAGGSRMWYWAGAAVLGIVLSVGSFIW